MRKSRLGQAMVELALVLPLFLMLIFAIVDFGRIFHIWSSLNLQCVEAAREGAKRKNQLIARNVILPSTHSDLAAVQAAFRRHRSPAVDENRYCDAAGNILGLNAVEFIGVASNAPEVTVRAYYPVEMITPMIGEIFKKITGKPQIVISAEAVERKE